MFVAKPNVHDQTYRTSCNAACPANNTSEETVDMDASIKCLQCSRNPGSPKATPGAHCGAEVTEHEICAQGAGINEMFHSTRGNLHLDVLRCFSKEQHVERSK
jgi:hypothetical protein